MSSRHQRRKRAAIKKETAILGQLQAERGQQIAKIVRHNLSTPKPVRDGWHKIQSSVAIVAGYALPTSEKEGKRRARMENPTISRQEAKKFKS